MPSVLELYEKLKSRLGEEETRALLEYVEASVERRAATKEDLQRTEMALREDLHRLDQALREELHRRDQALWEELQRLDRSLHQELQQVREELHNTDRSLREEIRRLDQKIETTKIDLIKWVIALWVGNVAALSSIMYALLRFFGR
jgi:multidrug resistance efflux pump